VKAPYGFTTRPASGLAAYPAGEIDHVSPGRRWVMAIIPFANRDTPGRVAILVAGGAPRLVCSPFCNVSWSSNGRFIFIPVEESSRTGLGRSLAIPVGPGESLGDLPPGGIEPQSGAAGIPGAQWVMRADFVPGRDPSHYAYVSNTVHRNLYRISVPGDSGGRFTHTVSMLTNSPALQPSRF
jgi:hypothetical protein